MEPLLIRNKNLSIWEKDDFSLHLASSVPYLKLDLLPSQLYGLDLEVDPNCRDEGCVEGVLRKSET